MDDMDDRRHSCEGGLNSDMVSLDFRLYPENTGSLSTC